MINESAQLEDFYQLSVSLTGFSLFDLQATGVGQTYFDLTRRLVGESTTEELLARLQEVQQASGSDEAILAEAIAHTILNSPKLGPVARNIIKLWYLGGWDQMPEQWQTLYGVSNEAVPFIPSPQAYIEGLVWKAMDAHPMGANPGGYGSWSEPPSPAIA